MKSCKDLKCKHPGPQYQQSSQWTKLHYFISIECVLKGWENMTPVKYAKSVTGNEDNQLYCEALYFASTIWKKCYGDITSKQNYLSDE